MENSTDPENNETDISPQTSPTTTPTAPAVGRPEGRWENEGGAIIPPLAHLAASVLLADRARAHPPTVEQPRLYADLLAEADRLRSRSGLS